MDSNRHVFLRMTEEFYMEIPEEIRASYLRDKRVDEETRDWTENMQDPYYARMYEDVKETKKLMQERQYQLREERRNNK